MANVKEMGAGLSGSPTSASAAALEAKIAKKTVEMQAGQMAVEAAAKRAEQVKEELENERKAREYEKEPNKEEEKRDTSELSKQSRWFGIEGKILQEGDLKWILEMEQELWDKFLNWSPVEGANLSSQLEELSKLYLALLEAILTHTMGEEQAAQIERLDELLAQKLAALLDTDLKDLMDFLEQTKQTETMQNVKASVYKRTTGQSISGRTADQFYARGKGGANAGNTRFFMPDSTYSGKNGAGTVSYAKSSAYSPQISGEGTLYQLSKGRNVTVDQEFDARRRSGETQIFQRNQALANAGGKGRAGTGFSGSAAFTANELARANRFAAHINGSGNLLKNSSINARNEEVIGYLAAITSIKGQMFAASSGKENGMNVPMRNALNQMVDYYLGQKGAYKVYDYTTNAYERTHNPQKAMEEGLEYAYAQFQEKKENTAYRQQAAYSEEAGFFQMLLKNHNLQADLLKGMRLLEDNWKQFLKSIGENEKKGISLKMQKHSPWGAVLEPGEHRWPGTGNPGKMLLTQAAVAAALVIVYVCYRLFFG